ncbi:MAG: hypothetical protein SFV51_24715 [Bryobacteraceae bacterium]|nr:hypothetical protein [Bryobacteraceae bacterium]
MLGRAVLAFVLEDGVDWPAESREEYRLAEAALSGRAVEIAEEVHTLRQ